MHISYLEKLYNIHSPSNHEQYLSYFVQKHLDNLGVQYETDEYHQIYSIKPDTPLLSAHMDQVAFIPRSKTLINAGGIITGDGNIGADDKNGVWILLNLIERFKDKVSFIFSSAEESGGHIDVLLQNNSIEMEDIQYGLVFDRMGSGDIIAYDNDYGTKEFEDELVLLGCEFGYESAMGVFSDADELSLYVSCANISCGYYNQHTAFEYTAIPEIYNALEFGIKIINQLQDRYDPIPYADWWINNVHSNWNTNHNHLDHYPYPPYDGYNNRRINSMDRYYYCNDCDNWMLKSELPLYPPWQCPFCKSENIEIDDLV